MNAYKVPEGSVIKAWTDGVEVEEEARKQLHRTAKMPFIYKWLAVMPDVHWGMGSTVGSVIPTKGAIIPAAVGVDIGCGMAAVRTSLEANDLPDSLAEVRSAIEEAVPHGRSDGSINDIGSWKGTYPNRIMENEEVRALLSFLWNSIVSKHPKVSGKLNAHAQASNMIGTLGTGNHFIEICLDEQDRVWVMLHSGSRGIGNRIGRYFIEKAKEEMRRFFINLPDADLAYLPEGSELFEDYWTALQWAQQYARVNRDLMLEQVISAMHKTLPPFTLEDSAVNCHHNYVSREHHFGENVLVTRKGAVRARKGDLGIIPGSMGARSYIVSGKGNAEAFTSCSHGAGRRMSRGEAKKRFTLEDHIKATEGVECRKDEGVIDETPGAYKDIDAVMEAQKDLVEVVHTLRQIVCVKG